MSEGLMKKTRFFPLWMEDKELKWLEEMSDEGWQLKEKGYISYWFEKNSAKKYVYGYDFKLETDKDFSDYMQMMEEGGWQHCGSFANWHYFRRDRELGKTALYSDNASKVTMLKRVVGLLVFLAALNLLFIAQNMTSFFSIVDSFAVIPSIMFVIWSIQTIVVILLIYTVVKVVIKMRQLSKSINE